MDTKKLNMAMTILKFAIAVIGIIACIWVVVTSPGADGEELAQKDFAESAQMGLAINFTIITIVSAIALVLLFFAFQLATNTKKTVMSISGIVAAFVLYFILRLAGSSDTNESLQMSAKNLTDDATIAATTAGIWTVIIGIAVATLLALVGPFVLGKYRK